MANKTVVWIIILLMMLFQCSMAIFLPAMTLIAASYKTTNATIQMMPGIFMLGFGISGVIYGLLSDIYGRRRMQLIGLAIAICGYFLACIASSILIFLFAIFLQGAGIGSQDVLGRAMLCDLFDEKEFANAASMVSMSSPLMPIVAPLIGGYIAQYFHWRLIYAFLLVLSLICLIVTKKYLKETRTTANPLNFNLLNILRDTYRHGREIFSNYVFLSFFSASAAAVFGAIAFNALGPFIIQEKLGYSPVAYSWFSSLIGIGIFFGGFVSKLLNKKKAIPELVKTGLIISLIAGVSMLACSFVGQTNIVTIMLPMLIFMVGSGLTVPNANAGALAPFAKIAGTAGALQGGIQSILISIMNILLVTYMSSSQTVLGLTLTVISSIALVLMALFHLKN